ncbi:MAG: hypothetical protein QNI90_10360 [Dinoroseobacter sp.]|nr:hypothetical protein [Dinoroseobacter sp.]
MGIVCRAGKRIIDDAAEFAEETLRRKRREARRARNAARREVRDADRALRELETDGSYTGELKREMRKVLEKVREDAQKKLDKAQKDLDDLGDISSAVRDPMLRASETFAALDRASDEFKDGSFADASAAIMAIVSERHGDVLSSPPTRRTVHGERLETALTDEGLDAFASRFDFPVPSKIGEADAASARALYTALVPLMSSLTVEDLQEDTDDLMLNALSEMVREAIAATADSPLAELQAERAYGMRLPTRLREYRELPLDEEGPVFEIGDTQLEALKILKARTLLERDRDRNTQIGKAVLAIIGLDFLLDEFEDEDEWTVFLDGLWDTTELTVLVTSLMVLIKRVLARPGLWARLVRRHGRLGALRVLAGLGGRLVPAVFALALAYAWKSIYDDWQKRKAEWDAKLRTLYDASSAAGKDDLFMDNLGYIPAKPV